MPGGSGGGGGSAGGIGGSGGAPIDTGTAHLRIIHLSPDAGPLTICARRHTDDQSAPFDITVQAGLGYKSATPYTEVPAGKLDVRLVEAGASCQSEPVIPGTVTLDELAAEQRAMLTLAGLRTPGSLPAVQALRPRLFLDPGPQDKNVFPWVRFTVFSINTPSLDVGFYGSSFDDGTTYFIKAWEPASYGAVAIPKNETQVHGYRGLALSDDGRESIGLSVSPANSALRPDKSMPYLEALSDLNQYGSKYDLFTIGQYSGLQSITVLLCGNPGGGQTATCSEYSLE
jgi:hypothetical protein